MHVYCVFVKNDNKLLSSELTQLRNSVNQIDIVFLAMNDKKDTACPLIFAWNISGRRRLLEMYLLFEPWSREKMGVGTVRRGEHGSNLAARFETAS